MKRVLVVLLSLIAVISIGLVGCNNSGHKLVKVDAVEATCQADGNIEYWKCSECDKWFADAEGTIEITDKNSVVTKGNHALTKHDLVSATCTEAGHITYWTCDTCGKVFLDSQGRTETTIESVTILPLGHSMIKVPAKAATCTEDGNIEYYECSRCHKLFTDIEGKKPVELSETVIKATGHDYDLENIAWKWTGYTKATATFTCKNDASHKEVVNATITNAITTAATCTADGVKTYTAKVTFNGVEYKDTKTEVIAAIGHDYDTENIAWAWTDFASATATFTCKNDAEHKEVINATITSEITKAATCTVDGVKTYTAKATFNGVEYKDVKTETLTAFGHDYDKENAVWAWTDYSAATISFTCKNDASHVDTINATITSEITLAATCTADGVKTYTAKATFDGVEYTDTKTEVIAAIGHDYDTENIAWAWTDYASATATFTCKNDAEHKEVIDATITNAITTEPTCTATGIRTYTATVTFNEVTYTDTKTEVVDMLPHTLTNHPAVPATCGATGLIEYWSCDVCGKLFSDADGVNEITEADLVTAKVPHNFENGVCTMCGKAAKDLPLTNDDERIKAELIIGEEVPAGHWRYSYIEGGNLDGTKFTMTMPVEVVNELIAQGYDSISIDFARDGKKATRFIFGEEVSNSGKDFSLVLEQNKAIEFKDISIFDICDDGWAKAGYTNADSFAVNLIPHKAYNEADPSTYAYIDENFTYENGIYSFFSTGEYRYDLVLRKEYVAALKAKTDRLIVSLTGGGKLTFTQGSYSSMKTNTNSEIVDVTALPDGEDVVLMINTAWLQNVNVQLIEAEKKFDVNDPSTYLVADVESPFADGKYSTEVTAYKNISVFISKELMKHYATTIYDKIEFKLAGTGWLHIVNKNLNNGEPISVGTKNIVYFDTKTFDSDRDIKVIVYANDPQTINFSVKPKNTVYVEGNPETYTSLDGDSTYDNGVYVLNYIAGDRNILTIRKEYLAILKAETDRVFVNLTGGGWLYVNAHGVETSDDNMYKACVDLTKFPDGEDAKIIVFSNFTHTINVSVSKATKAFDINDPSTYLAVDVEKQDYAFDGIEHSFYNPGKGMKETIAIKREYIEYLKTSKYDKIDFRMGNGGWLYMGKFGEEEERFGNSKVITLDVATLPDADFLFIVFPQDPNTIGLSVRPRNSKYVPEYPETGFSVDAFTFKYDNGIYKMHSNAVWYNAIIHKDYIASIKENNEKLIFTLTGNNTLQIKHNGSKADKQNENIMVLDLYTLPVEDYHFEISSYTACDMEMTIELVPEYSVANPETAMRISNPHEYADGIYKVSLDSAWQVVEFTLNRSYIKYLKTTSDKILIFDAFGGGQINLKLPGEEFDGKNNHNIKVFTIADLPDDDVIIQYTNFATDKNEFKLITKAGHTLTNHPAVAATCTTAGNIEYWTCDICGKYFSDADGTTEITADSIVVEATGHDYDTANIAWAWTDFASATATFTCKNDNSHTEVVDAVITSEITTAATCTATGVKTYTATVTLNDVTYTNTKTEEIAATGHTLTNHPAVEATCDTDGNIEYWTCDSCGKYFTDAEGVTEVTADAVKLAKKGHTLTNHPAVDATTDATGNIEYWTCDVCNKIFSDAAGTVEITLEDTIIPVKEHNLVHHDAVAATCTNAGNIEYWTCSDCGKYFSDEFGKTEITADSVVINALGHDYDTANIAWAWTDFASATATFTCKNDNNHTEVVNATITNAITTEATCTATGIRTYTATVVFNEVTYTDTKTEDIAKLAHTLTNHSATESTCTAEGNIEYWTCESCGKYFTDAEGVTEVTADAVKLAKKAHTLTNHPAAEATITADGNIEYWTCDVCGKYFTDAEGTVETTAEAVVVPKLDGYVAGKPETYLTIDKEYTFDKETNKFSMNIVQWKQHKITIRSGYIADLKTQGEFNTLKVTINGQGVAHLKAEGDAEFKTNPNKVTLFFDIPSLADGDFVLIMTTNAEGTTKMDVFIETIYENFSIDDPLTYFEVENTTLNYYTSEGMFTYKYSHPNTMHFKLTRRFFEFVMANCDSIVFNVSGGGIVYIGLNGELLTDKPNAGKLVIKISDLPKDTEWLEITQWSNQNVGNPYRMTFGYSLKYNESNADSYMLVDGNFHANEDGTFTLTPAKNKYQYIILKKEYVDYLKEDSCESVTLKATGSGLLWLTEPGKAEIEGTDTLSVTLNIHELPVGDIEVAFYARQNVDFKIELIKKYAFNKCAEDWIIPFAADATFTKVDGMVNTFDVTMPITKNTGFMSFKQEAIDRLNSLGLDCFIITWTNKPGEIINAGVGTSAALNGGYTNGKTKKFLVDIGTEAFSLYGYCAHNVANANGTGFRITLDAVKLAEVTDKLFVEENKNVFKIEKVAGEINTFDVTKDAGWLKQDDYLMSFSSDIVNQLMAKGYTAIRIIVTNKPGEKVQAGIDSSNAINHYTNGDTLTWDRTLEANTALLYKAFYVDKTINQSLDGYKGTGFRFTIELIK